MRIPLRITNPESTYLTEPAMAPLVIYIAKYASILDDESRINNTRIVPETDLRVYISRTAECPNHQNYDMKFDFTTPDNVLHLCQVTIWPVRTKYRFQITEDFINIGFYSLHGLPDVALIYGFGKKAEVNLRK